jgi:hypothetical protein
MAVAAEDESSNIDRSGSAGLRGHPNTPSTGTSRPVPLAKSGERPLHEDAAAAKIQSNYVLLTKHSSGSFQHRGRKLVSSKAH